MQIEGADDRKLPLGRRLQAYLRNKFGRDAAKKAAALTGADVRTARGWVEEAREPKGEALLAIITELGRDGLLAVFSPEVEDHEARLRRQIDEHQKEVARLKAQLGASGSPLPHMGTEATGGVPPEPCVANDA